MSSMPPSFYLLHFYSGIGISVYHHSIFSDYAVYVLDKLMCANNFLLLRQISETSFWMH